jgi:hypothetical protein
MERYENIFDGFIFSATTKSSGQNLLKLNVGVVDNDDNLK